MNIPPTPPSTWSWKDHVDFVGHWLQTRSRLEHALSVCEQLSCMHNRQAPSTLLLAGLYMGLPGKTQCTMDRIAQVTGAGVVRLLKGVCDIPHLPYADRKAEWLKRLSATTDTMALQLVWADQAQTIEEIHEKVMLNPRALDDMPGLEGGKFAMMDVFRRTICLLLGKPELFVPRVPGPNIERVMAQLVDIGKTTGTL